MIDISRYISINSETFGKLGLPANIVNVLEGTTIRPPEYPDFNKTEDTRLIAGGMASSITIRQGFDYLANNILSLAEQEAKNSSLVTANNVALEGLTSLQASISLILSSLNAVTGSATLIDFYQNSPAVLNTSVCNIDTLYGQVTLPYLSSPESQIKRPGHNSARPGTIIGYAVIPRATGSLIVSDYNTSDPSAFWAVDGSYDSAWQVPVNSSTEDLLVNIKLSPTLGRNAYVNSVGVTPWPTYGAAIVELYIKTNEVTSLKGFQKVLLTGQLNYNPATDIIDVAGAHRFFFSGQPVTEILVRLRPLHINKVGLVNLDCWSITFNSSGILNIDTSFVGVSSIQSISLAGLDVNTLSRITPYTNGSQLSLTLNTASIYESPVITSIGLKEHTAGTELTGFDFDVFTS